MTERAWLRPLIPLALLAVLATAAMLPAPGWLVLGAAGGRADAVADRLDALSGEPLVIIGFDPDLGTYAEVRPTVRALLADLLARDARLAFISFTPEGRALAAAELERLARVEANQRRIVDLGFVPGAEAALVELTREIEVTPDGAVAGRLADAGLGAAELAVVVGGNDLGPRSWVEQVLPRAGDLDLVAVAPTVLLPELLPYVESGQLDALLGTPSDGAAYRAQLELGRLERLAADVAPSPVALVVGMALALVMLGHGVAIKLVAAMRATRRQEFE